MSWFAQDSLSLYVLSHWNYQAEFPFTLLSVLVWMINSMVIYFIITSFLLHPFTVFLIKQWNTVNCHHSFFWGRKFMRSFLLIGVLAFSTYKYNFVLVSKWSHNSFPIYMSDLISSHTLSHSLFLSPKWTFCLSRLLLPISSFMPPPTLGTTY